MAGTTGPSPGHGAAPGGNQGPATSSYLDNDKDTRPGTFPHHGAQHVLAPALDVVARSGRHRWVLTARCPHCGQHHAFQARGELPVTLEKVAACGRGWLVLHVVSSRAVAAA